MRKPMFAIAFDFLEAIEIKLSYKTLIFLMTEIKWDDLCLHFLLRDKVQAFSLRRSSPCNFSQEI